MSSLGGDASRNLSPQSGCNNNNNKKDSNETINIIRCRIKFGILTRGAFASECKDASLNLE